MKRNLSNSNDQFVIDDEDESLIAGKTWGLTNAGYVRCFVRSKVVMLHRLLTSAPPKTHVDHINGDKLDNRRGNLRVTSPKLNQSNRHKLNRNNSSGARGVAWVAKNKRWRAQIVHDKRTIHIGMFLEKKDAIAARKAAELEYYGELCPDF